MIAGDAEPNCIMMAGEPFGTTPQKGQMLNTLKQSHFSLDRVMA